VVDHVKAPEPGDTVHEHMPDVQRIVQQRQRQWHFDPLRQRHPFGASMTAVSLPQTGIVKYLPDPPVKGLDSDRVNTSETAYRFGLPDGTLASPAWRPIFLLPPLGQRTEAVTSLGYHSWPPVRPRPGW
jgi:hypothetical protein